MISTIGIVGAGQMGNGIAHVCAASGHPVRMLDVNQEAIDRGLRTIGGNLDRQLSKGTITAELYPASAPITVNNYLSYVGSGFYRDILFHRVIAGFVIQAGGFTAGMVKKVSPSEAIQLESNQGLSNLRGTMAMARTSVFNSATSEFYFNVADNLALDYKNAANPGYAVFGKVVQGLDVVDAIASQPTGAINGFADVPLSDVSIVLAFQSK